MSHKDKFETLIFYCKQKSSDAESDSDLVAVAKMRTYALMIIRCLWYKNNSKSFKDFVSMRLLHDEKIFLQKYHEDGGECEEERKLLRHENKKLIDFICKL